MGSTLEQCLRQGRPRVVQSSLLAVTVFFRSPAIYLGSVVESAVRVHFIAIKSIS